jgi:hypothetical protein
VKSIILTILLIITTNVYAEQAKESVDNALTADDTKSQPTDSAHQNLRELTAEACQFCHQKIYQQWKGSMHANSSALKDPIHGTFYQNVIGDPLQEGVKKKDKYPVCLYCHAPQAALAQKTKLDAKPTYNDGVNCITCHTLKRYNGIRRPDGTFDLGIQSYEMSDLLQGSSGKTFSASPKPPNPPDFHPYPIEGNTVLLRTTDACMGCHDQRNNIHDVPLCETGAEFKDSGAFNCQQCHMPVNDGIADHSMHGGHSEHVLKRGIILTLSVSPNGETLKTVITVENTLPHNMPTGAPFRNMFLKLTAFDSDGKPLWHNFKEHPIKEDKQAMFMLALVDDEGKSAPPPEAKRIATDTRLKPKERRVLNYTIPASGVTLIQAEMMYDLLLPPFKKFPTIPDELKAVKVIARAEYRL